jgi:hypothetical protein
MPDTARITLNVFDGTRRPVSPELDILITIRDGNLQQLFRNFHNGPTVNFDVPFNNNFADNYTIIAFAKGYSQAGYTPVHVSPHLPQVVDLMLLLKKATFDFSDASWAKLSTSNTKLIDILSQGATVADAKKRYADLTANQPSSLACLLNITTAMTGIQLPQGTPLDYLKGLRWDAKSIKQDSFFAFCDKALVSQVKLAVAHKTFAPEPGFEIFHKGATSSYKEVQFGEGNVQLSFHENDTAQIDGVDCVIVEADIDYYKDILAHGLLEVIPNHFAGPTDPKTAYVLRWIAGQHAGVPEFNPPYVIA